VSCLQDFTFFNINLTTWKALILYFNKSTFDILSLSGQYFTCYWRVGTQKMDPYISDTAGMKTNVGSEKNKETFRQLLRTLVFTVFSQYHFA